MRPQPPKEFSWATAEMESTSPRNVLLVFQNICGIGLDILVDVRTGSQSTVPKKIAATVDKPQCGFLGEREN